MEEDVTETKVEDSTDTNLDNNLKRKAEDSEMEVSNKKAKISDDDENISEPGPSSGLDKGKGREKFNSSDDFNFQVRTGEKQVVSEEEIESTRRRYSEQLVDELRDRQEQEANDDQDRLQSYLDRKSRGESSDDPDIFQEEAYQELKNEAEQRRAFHEKEWEDIARSLSLRDKYLFPESVSSKESDSNSLESGTNIASSSMPQSINTSQPLVAEETQSSTLNTTNQDSSSNVEQENSEIDSLAQNFSENNTEPANNSKDTNDPKDQDDSSSKPSQSGGDGPFKSGGSGNSGDSSGGNSVPPVSGNSGGSSFSVSNPTNVDTSKTTTTDTRDSVDWKEQLVLYIFQFINICVELVMHIIDNWNIFL